MRKNTILWADDDADDLQLMREILLKNDKDFAIVEVDNGKKALEYLDMAKERSHLPCLIILDINMPVVDGKEALAIIKQDAVYKKIPVVIFTTSESELDKLFCQKFNTEMITKPTTFQSLEASVVKLLGFCQNR